MQYPPSHFLVARLVTAFKSQTAAALSAAMLLFFVAMPSLALDAGIRSLDQAAQLEAADTTEATETTKTTTEAQAEKATKQNTVVSENNQGNRASESAKTDRELRLLADLRVHSPEELEGLLKRVDQMFAAGNIQTQDNPVVFLLHGEEARTLYKSNYAQHKRVVDLAAKLSAFDVIDVRVCEAWADNRGLDSAGLQPFVDTVKYAPAEKKRLVKKEGYTYF